MERTFEKKWFQTVFEEVHILKVHTYILRRTQTFEKKIHSVLTLLRIVKTKWKIFFSNFVINIYELYVPLLSRDISLMIIKYYFLGIVEKLKFASRKCFTPLCFFVALVHPFFCFCSLLCKNQNKNQLGDVCLQMIAKKEKDESY